MNIDGLTILLLILYALSLLRVTRLINADTITDPIRIAAAHAFGPESTVVYFLQCPWCVSIWLAFGTGWIVPVLTPLPLWIWPFLALAASYLAGIAAAIDRDADDLEIEIVDD